MGDDMKSYDRERKRREFSDKLKRADKILHDEIMRRIAPEFQPGPGRRYCVGGIRQFIQEYGIETIHGCDVTEWVEDAFRRPSDIPIRFTLSGRRAWLKRKAAVHRSINARSMRHWVWVDIPADIDWLDKERIALDRMCADYQPRRVTLDSIVGYGATELRIFAEDRKPKKQKGVIMNEFPEHVFVWGVESRLPKDGGPRIWVRKEHASSVLLSESGELLAISDDIFGRTERKVGTFALTFEDAVRRAQAELVAPSV